MGTAIRHGLRHRMPTPRRPGIPERTGGINRMLRLAAELFDVASAALVLVGDEGLRVEAVAGDEACRADALASAGQLFDVLGASRTEAGTPNASAGVLEDVTLSRGYGAAAPIPAADGRCLGALCLLDPGRRTLLSPLQRRLFAEFGGIAASALCDRPRPAVGAPRESATLLQNLADAEDDAVALFDADGRCLLRNARFDTLLAPQQNTRPAAVAAARGHEAAWLSRCLARDREPVGVYRAALADGTWLCVEERRTSDGYSLIGRVEGRGAPGRRTEAQLLFERCPFAMFVVDRVTRAVLAANPAALALYGWDENGLGSVDLDSVGPVDADPDEPLRDDAVQDWTHRTRDGRPIVVSGRSIDLVHHGRPAMLVTVMTRIAGPGRSRERAA